MIDLKELRKLIKICRNNGICKIKTAQFELELSPDAISPKITYKKEDTPESTPLEKMSDDEILLWSVPNVEGAS